MLFSAAPAPRLNSQCPMRSYLLVILGSAVVLAFCAAGSDYASQAYRLDDRILVAEAQQPRQPENLPSWLTESCAGDSGKIHKVSLSGPDTQMSLAATSCSSSSAERP